MLFGLDGVEIGLIIVFMTLFGAILSGFPVAFAIGGAAMISFAIVAGLDARQRTLCAANTAHGHQERL